jgi:phosphoribosylformylglycinamidine cyclo-ligase
VTDYRASGVDIDEGERAVRLMRDAVRSTFTPRVLSDLGGFGGLFRAEFPGIARPVLVASTDGVGTKLKVAGLAGDYSTVGADLVNHCVNDILTLGAEPLFFLDYIACGRLSPETAASIVTGMSQACREAGCALLGGETAEMPGFYAPGDYDVAGTIVGVVDEGEALSGASVEPGMVLVGLPSAGLHTNGFSLARKVLLEDAGLSLEDSPEGLGTTLGRALLAVHRCYLGPVLPLVRDRLVAGICHVTGGGIPGNLVRILPPGCGAVIVEDWTVPPVFGLIERLGRVPREEMRRAFNMGAGMILAVSGRDADRVMERLAPHSPFIAGGTVRGGSVDYA